MNYDYLYELTVVAEERSFSKAARRLAVSQPALGRHMDALEASLGAKLLIRSPKGVELTSEGRYVQNRALDIVSIGELIEDYFLKRRGSQETRTVYVGGLVTSKSCRGLFEMARAEMEESGCFLSVRYLENESFPSVADALESSLADIVIVFRSSLEAEELEGRFRCEKIVDSPLDVITERNHPLAERGGIRLEDLRNFTVGHLFGRKRNASVMWEEFKRVCDEKGFYPLSSNVGWEVSPGWGTWYLPDVVLVFPSDLCDTELLESFGKSRITIESASYEVFAVARADDGRVNDLLDRMLALRDGVR